jgi:hypothetical protein
VAVSCLVGAAVCAGCFGHESANTDTAGARNHVAGIPPAVSGHVRALGLTAVVPRALVKACQRLASRARAQGRSHPFYCLPLVPRSPSYRVDAAGGLTHGYQDLRATIGVSVRSSLSSEGPSQHGHWTFAQGEPKALIGAYIPARVRGQVRRLAGRQVTMYELPEGQSFYSGHVVIEWRQRDLAFQVSMHGHENVSRVELMSRLLMGEVAACPSAARMTSDERCRLVF